MEALYFNYLDMYCAVKKRYTHKVIDFLVDTANEMLTDVDNRLFTGSDLDFLLQFKNKQTRIQLYRQTDSDDRGASVYARLLINLFQIVKKLSYSDQIIVCENFERLKLHENFRNDSTVRGLHEPVEQAQSKTRVLTLLFQKQRRKATPKSNL